MSQRRQASTAGTGWWRGISLFLLSLSISSHAAGPGLVGTEPAEPAARAVSSLLTDLVFTGEQYVAVGWRGHILRSANARDWQQAAVPVNVQLTAVAWVGDRMGWVVGHDAVVLHTRDAGKHWQVQHYEPGAPTLLDVVFFDSHTGLAVGTYGAMYATRDGGKTWTAATNWLTADGFHLNDVTRLGDGSLLLVGEFGTMAHSTDAGATWRAIDSPYENSIFAAASRRTRGAVIGGLRGKLFMTDDVLSGHWRQIDNPWEQSIFGVSALPSGSGHLLAAQNGLLLTLGPNGELASVTLDKESAGLPPAAPQGPPYVLRMSDSMENELGAFVHALPHEGGFLTVGHAGLRYWR